MESQVNQPGSAEKSLLVGKQASRRAFKDKAAEYGITIGGTMVFVALLLIFFYLLYVIKPIFDGAHIEPITSVSYQNTDAKTLMVGADEQNEILYRVTAQGIVDFYSSATGQLISSFTPKLPEGTIVTSSAKSSPNEQRFALGLSNGQVIVVGVDFSVSYPDNQRLITPKLNYPIGDEPLTINQDGAVYNMVFDYSGSRMSFAYQDANGAWKLNRQEGEENMMTEEVEWTASEVFIDDAPKEVVSVLMTPDHRQLILSTTHRLFVYNTRDADAVELLQVLDVKKGHAKIKQVDLLAGASSIMVSYDSGVISQYFQVNGEKGRLYELIREFDDVAPVSSMATEFYRKSFAVLSAEGELTLLYTTSQRNLFDEKFELKKPGLMAFSPRSNALIIEANNKLNLLSVQNDHPEVSWSALWQKVWYEGYPEPKYVWQSTSGSDDFEAKLSLMPLAFGTMKAAFYAMLFAVPLAIAGAIYTAYFMSPKVRNVVKPTIEIMEALPTVILGFLAGLWLAPLIEDHLPGIVVLLMLLPTSILATAFAWSKLPETWKHRLPETYQELMLIPVIIFIGWFSFEISPVIEVALFDGNTRQFITNDLGITFDQRNALVVGIAMGFAVIPTIFSIAEDAIFSVPRHLSNGSLALGATNWQTLTKVVLLTASPGIFSAIMMGLGRAVGETMIVLMATGNTAILEWSVFEGMRTLAANIAVEMPESAIGSTHYRVLFLAAFVLFIFTFFFNTIAEVVRQRLRERYSSL